jgi:DNA repair ATPase RecN
MSETDDFSGIYRSISEHVTTALTDISGISISSEKGRAHLGQIQNQLNALKEKFDGEIAYLDKNAEWEKLTIAFFGETGAGKSTIIESLRVIFNERERQTKIAANQASCVLLQTEFSRDSENLIASLKSQYRAMANDAVLLIHDVGALAIAVREESQATQDVFQSSAERMIQTLNDRSGALHAQSNEMGRILKKLTTDIHSEQTATRDSFSQDSQNLIVALRSRGHTLDADLALLAASIRNVAGIAKEEDDARRQRQRRQILLGLLAGLAGGLVLGGLGFALLKGLH